MSWALKVIMCAGHVSNTREKELEEGKSAKAIETHMF